MHFYWGARGEQDLYLPELPRRWTEMHPEFTYTAVLSEPHGAEAVRHRTGFVHEIVLEDWNDLSGFDVYMSGPPPIRVTAGALV